MIKTLARRAHFRVHYRSSTGAQVAFPQTDLGPFVRYHASHIWACDLLQTYDLLFRTVFVFVIIEPGSRGVVHFGVTHHPADPWLDQRLCNATPFAQGPRFPIRDNDAKFGTSFARAAARAGIEVLRTPFRAPRANPICERFLGSLRWECLDFVLILGERQLYRTVREYVNYFNHARPHQGIEQRIPCAPDRPATPPIGASVASPPVLGGLHHHYGWLPASSTAGRASPVPFHLH